MFRNNVMLKKKNNITIKRVLLAVAQRLSQQWYMLIEYVWVARIMKRSDWKEKKMMKKKNNGHPKRAFAGSN